MPRFTWLGHSAIRLEDDQHVLFVDPFLRNNPFSALQPEDVEKCDFILVTHGHADHVGDTVELAKAHQATVIASYELAKYFESQGVAVHPMSVGGRRMFPFGAVKMTPAIHGSGGDAQSDGTTTPPNTPVGFLITLGHKTVYHAGDTCVFSDMALIGQWAKIDLACLPVGDNFTMGVEDAVRAAKFLKAGRYVPIHYNTWEVIESDPVVFAFKIQHQGRKCSVLQPGEIFKF